MFTELELSTISIIAQIDINIDSNKIVWACPDRGALKGILTPRWESWQRGYKRPIKIKESSRGRKKKKRLLITKTDHFGSHVTFVVQRWTLRKRNPLNNKYSTTAVPQTADPLCRFEYIPKEYLVKIFNGGKIICLGILRRDKSDIKWVLNVIKKFLHVKLNKPCNIRDLKSTLENYKFQLKDPDYNNINLIKLQLYYMNEVNSKLTNINFAEVYKIIYELIISGEEFDPKSILRQLKCTGQQKKMFVYEKEFIDEFNKIKITEIKNELNLINIWLYQQNDKIVDDKYREWFAHDYIYFKLKNIREKLHNSTANIFHNIRYRPNQSDVLIEHMINNRRVSIKIFGSGSFNIKGCRSYETALQVYNYINDLFKKIGNEVVYCKNYPPIINLDDFLLK